MDNLLIELALFTSVRSARNEGYQLAAVSPGVSKDDARALSKWGPAHNSLCDDSPHGSSVNFHPLPSGRFCVSRSVAAGPEWSGRGGQRIATHMLVVSPETLARFANDPFRLLAAVEVAGRLPDAGETPERLEPFYLPGRAATVDGSLLARLSVDPGRRAVCGLLDAVLDAGPLGVIAPVPAERLFAGLLNLLPVSCRTELTFTTGLKETLSRPFGLIAFPANYDARHPSRDRNRVLYDLRGESADLAHRHAWTGIVAQLLSERRVADLSNVLKQVSGPIGLKDLKNLVAGPAEELVEATQ
jgi:hypothetical protein